MVENSSIAPRSITERTDARWAIRAAGPLCQVKEVGHLRGEVGLLVPTAEVVAARELDEIAPDGNEPRSELAEYLLGRIGVKLRNRGSSLQLHLAHERYLVGKRSAVGERRKDGEQPRNAGGQKSKAR